MMFSLLIMSKKPFSICKNGFDFFVYYYVQRYLVAFQVTIGRNFHGIDLSRKDVSVPNH